MNPKTNSSSYLQGKPIVVIGATSGIGFQAAMDFAQLGAQVLGVGRNSKRSAAAKQQIQGVKPGPQTVGSTPPRYSGQ